MTACRRLLKGLFYSRKVLIRVTSRDSALQLDEEPPAPQFHCFSEAAVNAIAALGIRLQSLVDARWITLEDLARVLGTTPQTINDIRAGTCRLSRALVNDIDLLIHDFETDPDTAFARALARRQRQRSEILSRPVKMPRSPSPVVDAIERIDARGRSQSGAVRSVPNGIKRRRLATYRQPCPSSNRLTACASSKVSLDLVRSERGGAQTHCQIPPRALDK
jgi:hypothetical protein